MCAEQRDGRVMYSILLKGIQVKCIVQLAEMSQWWWSFKCVQLVCSLQGKECMMSS